MIVKYLGKTETHTLTNGELYKVLTVEKGWYRIIDKSGEDYLYPPEEFMLVR